jgi:hypothetical protein
MRDEADLASEARVDVDELVPYLAGQVGEATLGRLAGSAHPELDQHVAAVREAAWDVLGRRADDPGRLLGFLVRYASGFVAAAAGSGWRPVADSDLLDWESMRLAAVCHLVRTCGQDGDAR